MDKDVRIYGIRLLVMWIFGGLFAVLALPLAALVIWRFPFADGFDDADGIAVFGLLFFGALAAYCFGLAVNRPVGLRLDADGMSGYFAPTLSWDDVERVMPKLGGRGEFVLLEVKDRAAFKARQSRWAQVARALNLNMGLAHVNARHLKAKPEDVRDTVERYLTTYGQRSL